MIATGGIATLAEAMLRRVAQTTWMPARLRQTCRDRLAEVRQVRKDAAALAALMTSAAADHAAGAPNLRRGFEQRVGYVPDFENPRSHNEKINWRKLYDRNPIYPVICDKLRVRDHVAGVLGQDAAKHLFPRMLGVSANPSARWLRRFGTGIAIKANNGCSANLFVMPGDRPDWYQMARTARRWMRQQHGVLLQEWAYWQIPPRVIVEELLVTPDGRCADDIKFAMFDGVCRFIQIDHDRFGHKCEGFFWPDGTRIDVAATPVPRTDFIAHKDLDRMLMVAERLSAGFDHIRVDFLVAGDRFALNELTIYRGSGLNPFIPESYDFEFGAMWTLRPWQGQIGRGR